METREKMEEELVRVEEQFCELQCKEAALLSQAGSLRLQLQTYQNQIAKDKNVAAKNVS